MYRMKNYNYQTTFTANFDKSFTEKLESVKDVVDGAIHVDLGETPIGTPRTTVSIPLSELVEIKEPSKTEWNKFPECVPELNSLCEIVTKLETAVGEKMIYRYAMWEYVPPCMGVFFHTVDYHHMIGNETIKWRYVYNEEEKVL